MTDVTWRVSDWPAEDQALWGRMTKLVGPLDEGGELTHLRATSIRNVEVAYGRWLCWLGKHEPTALNEPPIPRVTPQRVQLWMESVQDCAPNSRKIWIDGLIRFLTAAEPDVRIPFLQRVQCNLLQLASEHHGDRKIGRIPSSLDLIEAALAYADAEEALATSRFERARRQRDAAMIVFLSMLPIRRRTFVSLELGRTLISSDKEIAVLLAPEEVKNKKHYEIVLREPGASLLRRYLEEARPFLHSRASDTTQALWLADTGLPYSYSYIGKRIPLLTERLIGMNVPPHFFRDALATTFARVSPDLARGTKAILGHSDYRTSERHYNHAQAIEAGRSYSDVLLELAGPQRVPPKRHS
jgi:integrase/recombinase XerD